MAQTTEFKSPRVACVGAGNIGRSWAIAYAMGGADVQLFDVSEAAMTRAWTFIDAAADDFVAAGLLARKELLRERIRGAASLADALDGVQHVQESVSDDPAVKRQVFVELDALTAPSITIGSSSGELPVSKFTEGLPGASRCLLVHPVNPPHILRAVEICPTPWTQSWAVAACRKLVMSLGMVPIDLKREINGYVINRLQYALIGEALHLVGEGYCEPKDIDAAIKHGLGLRWAFLGPFETSHLNATRGYNEYMLTDEAGARRLMADIRADYRWDHALIERIHEYLIQTMKSDDILRHQQRRDRTLLSLMQHLKEQAPLVEGQSIKNVRGAP
ncbi:3-hydroxyacyl-CoA dehydrogenase NAD-binding domain-containing protein [Steroidobacter flavus]|uniref:3-hydroxyacyl-CoA dehydrogenase NAD-binding domain-containing protein n=1 Tax=Steroidobacter flavus TaxID=1842136 RepID=A0ABV8T1H9_9GAMM